MQLFYNDFVTMEFEDSTLTVTVLKEFCRWEELEGIKEACTVIFEQCLSHKYKIAVIFDTRKMGMLPLTYMNWIHTFLVGKRPITVQFVASYSIVLTNNIVKRLINQFLAMNPKLIPTEFFNTVDDANKFSKEKLKEFVSNEEINPHKLSLINVSQE